MDLGKKVRTIEVEEPKPEQAPGLAPHEPAPQQEPAEPVKVP